MKRISIQLDDADAEWLEARINETKPTLEDVAKERLSAYAREIQQTPDRSSCGCGKLDDISSEKNSPIIFDPVVNEYGLQRDTPWGKATHVIRYCLWCGGRAPKSKRDQLFVKVDYVEIHRLTLMCAGINTFKDAMDRFGLPETDRSDGAGTLSPTADGAAEYTPHRVLTYEKLSDTADVWVTQRAGDIVSVSFGGKFIGPPVS